MEKWINAVGEDGYEVLVPYPFEWDENGKLICSNRPMLNGPPAPDPSTDTSHPAHSIRPNPSIPLVEFDSVGPVNDRGFNIACWVVIAIMSITALIVIVLSNKGAI